MKGHQYGATFLGRPLIKTMVAFLSILGAVVVVVIMVKAVMWFVGGIDEFDNDEIK